MRRLEKHGIHTMGELARVSLYSEDMLYREFGVDAEILIDHAWGLEPCGMKEINTYQPETNSICEGRCCPALDCEKTRHIVREMTDSLIYQLMDKGLVTDGLTLDIGYDGGGGGELRQGRLSRPGAHRPVRPHSAQTPPMAASDWNRPPTWAASCRPRLRRCSTASQTLS